VRSIAAIARTGLKLFDLPEKVVIFDICLIWTAMYIASGQYALDRRLDQWIK
jgi:hypothetical protein